MHSCVTVFEKKSCYCDTDTDWVKNVCSMRCRTPDLEADQRALAQTLCKRSSST